MPITVIDSFEHLLPSLPMKVKDREDKRNDKEKKDFPAQYHTVKESSISTRRAIPIAGYIKQDAGSLMLLARAKIAKVKNIDEFMPGVEKTYLLANEADVVRASAQHLVYPINMLLPELFPGVNLRIVCNSEVPETNESRFDMSGSWLCRARQLLLLSSSIKLPEPYTELSLSLASLMSRRRIGQ